MNTLLNKNNICLTRYLYVKEEVMIALYLSIIHLNHEESLFWAFELFYSGFKTELNNLLWEIYYEFFYSLNPSFENYLFIKFKDDKIKEIKDEKNVRLFIDNLMIREKSHDMYLLLKMVEQFDIDCSHVESYVNNPKSDINILYPIFINLLESNDYLLIAHLVIKIIHNNHLESFYIYTMNVLFGEKKTDKYKKKYICYHHYKLNESFIFRKIILANILHSIYLKKNIKLSKNIYAHENNNNENSKYYTLSNGKRYHILKKAYVYSVDTYGFLSLFPIQRKIYQNNNIFKETIYNNWIQFIHSTPLWKDRLFKHGCEINIITDDIDINEDIVVFISDEEYENFNSNYYYEFEEQSLSTQEKAIPPLITDKNHFQDTKNQWIDFHKKSSFLEYEPEYIDELKI
jgi:hypothetical protein